VPIEEAHRVASSVLINELVLVAGAMGFVVVCVLVASKMSPNSQNGDLHDLQHLRPTMNAACNATSLTDAPVDTTDATAAVRRGTCRGKPLSNDLDLASPFARLMASKFHGGAVATVAVKFGVSRHCVGDLLKRGQENGGEYLDVEEEDQLLPQDCEYEDSSLS
jgi:hypothetical protein